MTDLKQIDQALKEAVASKSEMQAQMDKERIYNAAAASLTKELMPLLKEVAENSRTTVEIIKDALEKDTENKDLHHQQMMERMANMSIQAPTVNVEPSQIQVEVPEINVPKPEVTVNIPEIKIPPIKVPKPEVTVNVDAPDFTPLIKEMKALKPEKANHSDITTLLQQILDKEKIEIPSTIKLDKDQFNALAASMRVGGGGTLRTANKVSTSNVALTATNTQYTFTFPSNTLSWQLKLRDQGTLGYYSFTTGTLPLIGGGGDASNYVTIPQNFVHSMEGVEWSHKTIYLGAESASQVCEITCYTM